MSVPQTAALEETVVEYGFRTAYHFIRAFVGMCVVTLFGFYTYVSGLAFRQGVVTGSTEELVGGALLLVVAGGATLYFANLFFVRSPRSSFED